MKNKNQQSAFVVNSEKLRKARQGMKRVTRKEAMTQQEEIERFLRRHRKWA